jgi:hypothetical protein
MEGLTTESLEAWCFTSSSPCKLSLLAAISKLAYILRTLDKIDASMSRAERMRLHDACCVMHAV